MPNQTIHRHGDAFDERNLFLVVALGAVSWSKPLENILSWGRRRKAAPGTVPPPDPQSDLLYFVLGIASMSKHINSTLDAVKKPRTRSDGARLEGVSHHRLRDMLD